jgi:N-acetylglutamate synthase
VTDDELAALEHENLIAAFEAAGSNASDYLFDRHDGVVLIATGLPIRLFNQVIVERIDADPAALERAVGMLRARGAPFVVDLRERLDDRFVGTVTAMGLVPMAETPWLPGMAWAPLPADPEAVAPAGPGHEIRQVADADGIDDHIAVASAGFEMPESILREIVSVRLLERPDVAVYVGYQDGERVSTGMGVRTGRTIGVYNIATIESARRRGFGAAMTARVVADGRRQGCDVAILQASEMGAPIYARLGFRGVVDYIGYIDPPETAESDVAGEALTPAG